LSKPEDRLQVSWCQALVNLRHVSRQALGSSLEHFLPQSEVASDKVEIVAKHVLALYLPFDQGRDAIIGRVHALQVTSSPAVDCRFKRLADQVEPEIACLGCVSFLDLPPHIKSSHHYVCCISRKLRAGRFARFLVNLCGPPFQLGHLRLPARGCSLLWCYFPPRVCLSAHVSIERLEDLVILALHYALKEVDHLLPVLTHALLRAQAPKDIRREVT